LPVICAGLAINGMGVAGLLIVLGRRRFAVLYTIDINPFSRFLARFVKPSGHVIAGRAGEPLPDSNELYSNAKWCSQEWSRIDGCS
jgi:hypothetical protein